MQQAQASSNQLVGFGRTSPAEVAADNGLSDSIAFCLTESFGNVSPKGAISFAGDKDVAAGWMDSSVASASTAAGRTGSSTGARHASAIKGVA